LSPTRRATRAYARAATFYRGFLYGGFGDEAPVICPWCIADGSAHERLGAEFADVALPGFFDEVPRAAAEEVARRTPGYRAWQAEEWLAHCGDACEYHGLAGATELADKPTAVEMLREQGLDDETIGELVADEEHEPTAYLLRCQHCREWLAYFDYP
jgi:uncharacterized protein CbrC (UPF0167 family)